MVYGPQLDKDKLHFLEELEAIRDTCKGPWVVAGDFTLILDPADQNNDRVNHSNMARFRRTVDTLQLKDIHLHGRTYTWSNERRNPTLVKLDPMLTTVAWEELFPSCFLHAIL